jgi:hypothetical protein
MEGLAFFDQWVARTGNRKSGAHPAHRPSRKREFRLISPGGLEVVAFASEPRATCLLRVAHGISDDDWWGPLADESVSSGVRLHWRLALWRASTNHPGPQWLSRGFLASAGQYPASLRKHALERGVQALWDEGWRLVEADAFSCLSGI